MRPLSRPSRIGSRPTAVDSSGGGVSSAPGDTFVTGTVPGVAGETRPPGVVDSPAVPLVAGNWKMFKGPRETREFCRALGETDETVARRTHAALQAGLRVIACVGETLEERESGETELILRLQVESIRDAVGAHAALVVAYEPVWAIGTGHVATTGQIQTA